MRNELIEKINECIKIEAYKTGRNEILQRFSDYNNFEFQKKKIFWDWFEEYIIQLGWTRMYAYIFCMDLQLNNLISGDLENDFDDFFCTIIGEGILNENWIRFSNEPKDWHQLNEYISSKVWMNI